MRHRTWRHLTEEEDQRAAGRTRGAARPAERPPGVDGTPGRSSLADEVLGLQQSAGNQAVTRALAATQPSSALPAVTELTAALQRQPAQATANPSALQQLAAMWESSVVLPLARASLRVEGDLIDSRGALQRIQWALQTIVTIMDGTPTNDPNRTRLQTLGRMVDALFDLVAQRAGSGKTDQEILAEMIAWRSRALELEPIITNGPGMAPAGGGRGAGAVEAGSAGSSPTEAWHELVVLPLGRAQVRLEGSPAEAAQAYLHAYEGILLWLRATPRTDPLRLRLSSLSAGVRGTLDLLQARTGMGSTDVGARAIEAYEGAVALGERLTGKPGAGSPAAAVGSPGKPGAGGTANESEGDAELPLTWEREEPRKVDLADLERP